MLRQTTGACLLMLFATAVPALGQSVSAEISATDATVGEVLTVEVTVQNTKQANVPQPGPTRDFEISSVNMAPSQREQISIVNGRQSRTVSYTYRFDVKPLRQGVLTLPAFTVKDLGAFYRTRPIQVRVGQPATSPDMFVEVKSDPPDVAFVGQPVHLTLEIWVHRFHRGNFALDPRGLWQFMDGRTSSFGVFNDQESIKYRQDSRRDADGGTEEYFVYLIEKTLYPAKPGKVDIGNVDISYNYPVQLRRNIFGDVTADRYRRLRDRPDAPEVVVKPVPQDGRPADYNGAVGIYSIQTSAKPRQVAVGDPITLTMFIRGDGQLERLLPPRLDNLEALTKDFEVAHESPAGELEENRKNFSVTIRPLREDVHEIPPIPFSCLNPSTGQFETATSQAIPIKVTKAERLALAATPPPGQNGTLLVPLVEKTEGLVMNYTDPNAVLTNQDTSIGPGTWALLFLCPAACLASWIAHYRVTKLRLDEGLRRRTHALATARATLRGHDGVVTPGHVRAALIGYIADRCNVPAGGLTRDAAVALIDQKKVQPETVKAIDTFLESVEAAEYGGERLVEAGVDMAGEFISAMEKVRFK